MKMGILYVKKGQTTPKEWFGNGATPDQPLAPHFWDFVRYLGREIDLSTWTGYFGDMGAKGKTYFTQWDNTVDCKLSLASILTVQACFTLPH